MELLKSIEKALEGPLGSLPSLPKEAKEGLAAIWPWLALIGGVLQLILALMLFSWANTVQVVIGSLAPNAPGLTLWVWISVILLLIDAVILFMAFPKLQRKEKAGWDLLLLAMVINLLYAISSLLIDGRSSFGGLIWSVFVSGIGFYLLFQVREYFGGKKLIKSNTNKK